MADYGDTYCGIWCGACSILVHGETGKKDAFIACFEGVPQTELACQGCKSDAVYAGCRICRFRDCAIGRGIEHCVECADYPCREYKKWQSVSKLLPHIREAAASLETIRHEGANAWHAAQHSRWSCPGCGAGFSWYQTTCAECGRSLAGMSFALNPFRKLVCRVLLPKVFRKGKERK